MITHIDHVLITHIDHALLLFSLQMNELNKRMFAIESLLSRLEEKMTPADEVRRDESADLISSSFK